MRVLIVFALGLLLGAAGFHVYYRSLSAPQQCGWNHPLDRSARDACEQRATFTGYAKGARRQLDNLIGDLSR
ncbi:hypothetical protein [Sphingomonas abietis]|uniref:Uncharacterized protein n=1 Tax=Sphingomonas abietis TaxID=3012344 RepID=A0ABY7NHP6_9SPHN|nr:hypothetical protein [Sphingomonas abietis]WBO20792.1 hypothetical protein PBT88_11260 [Sphingomonas abietis]